MPLKPLKPLKSLTQLTPRGNWSLARQLLLLQVLVLAVLVAAGLVLVYLSSAGAAEDKARGQVVSVASTVADAPGLGSALVSAQPSVALQPLAERVRLDTGVDFVTIMDRDGIRFSHPNPALIGQRFLGNTADALRGRTLVETYTGTLGPSVRAVVPVFDPQRRVAALVAVGITVETISAELRQRLPPLLLAGTAALLAGVAGSLLVSARIRRQTRGVAPAELRTMFEYYEAILRSVREGLLLVDPAGRVVLCNDGARHLLELDGPVDAVPVRELGLPAELADTLAAAEPRTDELHLTDSRMLVVSTAPVRSGGRSMGTVVTLRDHTELQSLSGELDTMRGFTESLRSQAHESANRLHTVVSLVELGRPEQAVEFATAELEVAQRLTDRVVGAVAEPVVAALLLGKAAEAGERGVELVLGADSAIEELEGRIAPRDLVTILGNLLDNAIDAAVEGAGSAGRPRVVLTARTDQPPGALVLRVSDSGPGIAPEAAGRVFRRGWSTKPGKSTVDGGRGLGLALVGQAVRRCAGTIEVDHDPDTGGARFTVHLPLRTEDPR